jgi:hypothetical protein
MALNRPRCGILWQQQERTKRPTNFVSDVIVEREKREAFSVAARPSLSNATSIGRPNHALLRRNFLAHDDPTDDRSIERS